MSDKTAPTKTRKKPVRKPSTFILGWITSTAAETDEEGNVISPERTCFVQLPLPSGLTEKQQRDRNAIQRACKKAVYEGDDTYGNKDLVVLSYGEQFAIPFQSLPNDPEALKEMLPDDPAVLKKLVLDLQAKAKKK